MCIDFIWLKTGTQRWAKVDSLINFLMAKYTVFLYLFDSQLTNSITCNWNINQFSNYYYYYYYYYYTGCVKSHCLAIQQTIKPPHSSSDGLHNSWYITLRSSSNVICFIAVTLILKLRQVLCFYHWCTILWFILYINISDCQQI